MKRWLADHIWIVFWVVCLGQAALWVWWLNFAGKHTPERIEPATPRQTVVSPAEGDDSGNDQAEEQP